MDDKITKAMTYGGLIVALFGMWLFGQIPVSTDHNANYMLSMIPALITAVGYLFAALGVLLGKTGMVYKAAAIIVLLIIILIIAMRILTYFTIVLSQG
ncbi:MAG: hypothetical protein A4E48_00801 [Methanosaeta sp. PtaU1.Bin060]|nr:MAG: hypothetical protein A4E48_00801 [Methanosaeta sp. PtaU1.Bin060]